MLIGLVLISLAHAQSSSATLQSVLSSELDRAMSVLSERQERPHYIALATEDRDDWKLSATDGTLGTDVRNHTRTLDVDLRVGTPELDSTHELRGMSAWSDDTRGLIRLPIDDAPEAALRQVVWRELDRRYREAAEAIVLLRANQVVKVTEERPAPDFEPRTDPVHAVVPVPALELDRGVWQELLVQLSERLDAEPAVQQSSAELQAVRAEKVFVDTEGARLQYGRTHVRLTMQVSTVADDGDEVHVFDAWDAETVDGLPDRTALLARADAMATRVAALRTAPRGQPWTGPILLTGRASAVFFHEVFGHRVEGHRQKSSSEGQTFTDLVGSTILPTWIDVIDDPTLPAVGGVDLNGFYAFDDEGRPAETASLVDDGVFRGFLMSRSPIQGFEHSNGHGRRMAGRAPVARMGNTIVRASQTVTDARLRAMLLDEVRAQGLEYGILVEEIDGGFTMTGRMMPNAFNIRASASWKVFADGRPDELVRGIDLVGTPFAAFSNVAAAGDTPQVFNGYCGAESGWVPVSGIAPSLLFKRLEFQLKEKAQERPPLLPKPDQPDDGATDAEVVR